MNATRKNTPVAPGTELSAAERAAMERVRKAAPRAHAAVSKVGFDLGMATAEAIRPERLDVLLKVLDEAQRAIVEAGDAVPAELFLMLMRFDEGFTRTIETLAKQANQAKKGA